MVSFFLLICYKEKLYNFGLILFFAQLPSTRSQTFHMASKRVVGGDSWFVVIVVKNNTHAHHSVPVTERMKQCYQRLNYGVFNIVTHRT